MTVMSGKYAGSFVCRILDLTAANITDVVSMVQTEFSLQGISVRQKTQYVVNVRSLPEPSTTNSAAKDIYMYINTPAAKERIVDINNTVNWAFFIETEFDENEMTVRFSRPPEEYKFFQFLVQLIRHDKEKNRKVAVDYKITGEASVVFKNINSLIPGLYQISVEPYPNKKCTCKMNGDCSRCSISITSDFNITFGSGTEAPTTTTVKSITRTSTAISTSTDNTPEQPISKPSTEEPVNLGVLLGVGIPVTIVSGVILVVVIIILRRCKTGEDRCPIMESQKKPLDPDMPSSEIQDGQSPPKLIELNTTKTILLLYYADDEDHQKAVFCLANFLEGHCSMKVYLHDRCRNDIMNIGQDNWVVEKMKMVDWIVILNSEGAYEQYKHITNPCQQDSYILSDMFLCAIKMLDRHTDIYRDKFISAYFPYTDKRYLILQFTPKGIHYRLMDDIEQFFLRVNNCEKYHHNEVIDAVIANSWEYHLTEPGRKLKEIIDKKRKNASGTCQLMATSVEADVEHQNNFDSGIESGFKNNFDSGIESGFKNPLFGGVKNLRPVDLFDSNWGDEDASSNYSWSLKDPDALSCGSIGSAGRAEFDKFYQDCPPNGLYSDYAGMTRPNYQQEANDIDVINIDPMDIEEYHV